MTQTILITGASRGIGRALALEYAVMGNRLILIATHEERLTRVVLACRAQGATVDYAVIDVRDVEVMHRYITEVNQRTPIDLVIANAGIATTLNQYWQPEHPETIQAALDINVQGTFNTIHPLLSSMIARQSGHLVLMSSMAGLRGLPQSPSYCASKAAVLAYAEALNAWLRPYRIYVSVVCPGYVHTDMSMQLHGPKPLLISAERAAKKIIRGIRRRKSRIMFPRCLALLIQGSRFLPEGLVNRMLRRVESYQKT